jgi:hypothetical protein
VDCMVDLPALRWGTLAGTPIVDRSFDRGYLGPASVTV